MRDHRGAFLPPRAHARGGGFRGRGGETHRAHGDDDDASCRDGDNGEKDSSVSVRETKEKDAMKR